VNIFYLDADPILAAQQQCDKHVVKMILETAQLLSTAHRELDGDAYADSVGLYKATHKNHPSAVWVRECVGNYHWAHVHLTALCAEYTRRYDKTHKTQRLLAPLAVMPSAISSKDAITDVPQCMPDDYKCSDSVAAYRDYYQQEKLSQPWAKYAYTEAPAWSRTLESVAK
tara:strand:- start:63 stop:572 length:510 start_codon:yes stop_codon:yes gene_type:complete